MLLPALSKAKIRAQGLKCLNNMKQLQLGHILYAGDNQDKLPPNEGDATPPSSIIGLGSSPCWVAGSFASISRNTPAAPVGCETNVYFLGVFGDAVPGYTDTLNGSIGQYTKNAGIYKCPVDLTVYQRVLRVRSASANCFMGTTANDRSNGSFINPLYTVFTKFSDFTARLSASDAFVFTDENPASLNDGFLLIPKQARNVTRLRPIMATQVL